jgi:hypothetical protein
MEPMHQDAGPSPHLMEPTHVPNEVQDDHMQVEQLDNPQGQPEPDQSQLEGTLAPVPPEGVANPGI